MKKTINRYAGIVTAVFLLIVNPCNTFSQGYHQIKHISGTQAVDGVNVTVSSHGIVDTMTYCNGLILPYFAGYNFTSHLSGSGSYTFDFSTPVNGIMLHFGGLSNKDANYEEIRIYLNGSHYVIPFQGDTNGCEPLAALTLAGDIKGCNDCSVSGWKETIIPGPVTTLKVYDTMFSGNPCGALFSVYYCDSVPIGIKVLKEFSDIIVYPNPATDEISIKYSDQKPEIQISGILGQVYTVPVYYLPGKIMLYVARLSSGIYFLKFTRDNSGETRMIVVE